MAQATYISKQKGKVSIGFHTALPQQPSDGRVRGLPLDDSPPSMRKLAVLETKIPEPSQGTPGTARRADIYYTGMVLARRQRHGGGAQPPLANRREALVVRVRTKVKHWQAQSNRCYLALLREHTALTAKHTFGCVRLIGSVIRVSRKAQFRKPALPYGAMTLFVHDRTFALFRRSAVMNIR